MVEKRRDFLVGMLCIESVFTFLPFAAQSRALCIKTGLLFFSKLQFCIQCGKIYFV